MLWVPRLDNENLPVIVHFGWLVIQTFQGGEGARSPPSQLDPFPQLSPAILLWYPRTNQVLMSGSSVFLVGPVWVLES